MVPAQGLWHRTQNFPVHERFPIDVRTHERALHVDLRVGEQHSELGTGE